MTFNLVGVHIDPDAGNPDSRFPQNRGVGTLLDSKNQFPAFAVHAFAASGKQRHNIVLDSQFIKTTIQGHTVHSDGKYS